MFHRLNMNAGHLVTALFLGFYHPRCSFVHKLTVSALLIWTTAELFLMVGSGCYGLD